MGKEKDDFFDDEWPNIIDPYQITCSIYEIRNSFKDLYLFESNEPHSCSNFQLK